MLAAGGTPSHPGVTRPLMVKMMVADRISHGTSRKKVVCGVLSRIQAPTIPPITPVTSSGAIVRHESLPNCCRYAPMLATCPGHSATVLVAFALTGGMPMNSSVGNVTKLPPPATALMAPASSAAKNRMVAWEKFIR